MKLFSYKTVIEGQVTFIITEYENKIMLQTGKVIKKRIAISNVTL